MPINIEILLTTNICAIKETNSYNNPDNILHNLTENLKKKLVEKSDVLNIEINYRH